MRPGRLYRTGNAPPPKSAQRLPLAIALISAAALAYQLLLMRWLAIAHWYPFAGIIISLALLGHGASGSWLSLQPTLARRHFAAAFPLCALAFAVSAAGALWLAQRVPFNGLELVWNPRQLLWLSALYLVLAVPFFFAAGCFGLAFARHGARIPALYGADLAGAGLGALAAVALLYLPVERGLLIAALCGPVAALLVPPPRRWQRALIVPVALGLLALLPSHALAPPVNSFKGLSQALRLPQARIIDQQHSPYGWLALLRSPQVPLRYAPGLSLDNTDEPPPQLGIYTDGDALSVITRRRGSQAYLGRMTSALPYALLQRPDVLVLDAGGGQAVLQALTLGAASVDAVETNPQRLQWVADDYAGFAGGLYRDPRVETFVAAPRAFARTPGRDYDLIVLAGDGSFAGSGAGVQAASAQYGLTVQALRDYLARLRPGGLLAITLWRKQPPRDELRLLSTAIAALRAAGHDEPGARIAAIRSWDASTWLIKRGRFSAQELTALRSFAEEHGFDRVWHAGLPPSQVNRFHVLDAPVLYRGARALLSPRAEAYIDRYKFAIAPTTDDQPYFSNFFRWRTLPELWRLRLQGGAVLLDSGYLLLLATLAQALPLSLLLVLAPLLALPRGRATLLSNAPAPTPSFPRRRDTREARRTAEGRSRRDERSEQSSDSARRTAKSLDGAALRLPKRPRLRGNDEQERRRNGHRLSRTRAGLYFLALGLGFMLIEIAMLSRLTALVGHPLIAATVGLSGFLLFAGAGSGYAQRLLARSGSEVAIARRVGWAVLAIALGLGWQFAVFEAMLAVGAAWPVPARAAAGLLGIAPLAFAMGLPFALGLSRLARIAPAFVPWAWGLNGCASVLAAIGALLLAMAIGLRTTLLCALALYAFAAWVWRAPVGGASAPTRSFRKPGSGAAGRG